MKSEQKESYGEGNYYITRKCFQKLHAYTELENCVNWQKVRLCLK